MESSGSADRIPDGPPLDNRALFGLQRKGLSVLIDVQPISAGSKPFAERERLKDRPIDLGLEV